MRVLFLQPSFPQEMPRFVRGLVEVGAEVIGAGDGPAEALPPELRAMLAGWIRLPGYHDEEACLRAIQQSPLARGLDRLESLWEPTVLLAARAREALGLPGMSADTVLGFRDKQLMKERAKAAGARVPRSARARGTAEIQRAAEEIGYPLVVKPIAGAGSANTWACQEPAELRLHLPEWERVEECSVEEFIVGEEHTWDALCIDGQPVLESITRYIPPPLVARNEEWVSPAQITLRNPHIGPLMPGVALGRRVALGLGMQTGIVHMEWFRTESGEAILGEIACRPGGSKLMDQWNWAQDIDIYREWARAACWRACEARPQKAWNAGVVFKRAQGQGRIRAIHGIERLRAELGPALVEEALLPIGAPRRDWKQTLLSDGWLAIRDPDQDRCLAMMARAIRDVVLVAG